MWSSLCKRGGRGRRGRPGQPARPGEGRREEDGEKRGRV